METGREKERQGEEEGKGDLKRKAQKKNRGKERLSPGSPRFVRTLALHLSGLLEGELVLILFSTGRGNSFIVPFFHISQSDQNNACVCVHTICMCLRAACYSGTPCSQSFAEFLINTTCRQPQALSGSPSPTLFFFFLPLALPWISRIHSCQTNYSIYGMGISTCVT